MHVDSQARETIGCQLVEDVVRSFGKARLKVTGASMIPALWPGDIITVRYDASAELQLGQIVLYRRKENLVAHRVTYVYGDSVVTRGDALPQDDLLIKKSDIVGRVVDVARNGRSARLYESGWQWVFSSILRRSDFCLRMALRWHNRMRGIAWTD